MNKVQAVRFHQALRVAVLLLSTILFHASVMAQGDAGRISRSANVDFCFDATRL